MFDSMPTISILGLYGSQEAMELEKIISGPLVSSETSLKMILPGKFSEEPMNLKRYRLGLWISEEIYLKITLTGKLS